MVVKMGADRPLCLSTFTGLGGFDLGLEAAGFDHIGCVEWDEAARRSLKANRGGAWPLLEPGDIAAVAQELTPEHLGIARKQLDLLVGAPPCQPYSKAAEWAPRGRRGMGDVRGQYLDDFLTLVETFLPKVVLIENVRGFVSGRTSAIEHLQHAIGWINRRAEVDYRIEWDLLDAAQVGAPQHRTRAIVVITRLDRPCKWPDQVEPTTAWDAIGHLELEGDEIPEPRGKWAELLPSIPEGQNYLFHTPRGGGEPLFGWRTRYWAFLLKLAKSRPSWTIPAHPGPATGPFHWDNRPLAVKELLRLQTFPEDWIVEGPRTEQVKQVGNATPPLLGEALGRTVAEHLGCPVSSEPFRHAIARSERTPPPARVGSVAPKYLALRGDHHDHPGPGLGPGRRPRAS